MNVRAVECAAIRGIPTRVPSPTWPMLHIAWDLLQKRFRRANRRPGRKYDAGNKVDETTNSRRDVIVGSLTIAAYGVRLHVSVLTYALVKKGKYGDE